MSLYASREDAPRRMRKESHSAYLISFVVMGLVAILGWAAFTFLVPKLMVNSLQNGFTTKSAQPLPYDQPVLRAKEHSSSSSVQPAIEQRSIRPPAPHELDVQGRQVVFNGQNYQPNTNINLIQSSPTQYAVARAQATQSQRRSIKRSANWAWESAGKKVGGSFSWLETNEQIDYSTVCQNYTQGSLIYRDCRKGAKQSFARMCKQGKRLACHAENNYMP